jgi:hypothetical protein
MFCEVVEVDMANSKETSISNTISSTLSLITILCEDLFEAINIHKKFCGEKEDLKPSISLLSKTNSFDGCVFIIDIINNDIQCTPKRINDVVWGLLHVWFPEILQKFALFFCVEENKTMYGNNEDVPAKLMKIFLLSRPGIINYMIWQGVATDPVIPSYWTILNKRKFIIHNSMTWPVEFSLYTMPTMSSIYDKPGAGWSGINTDNYSKIMSKQVKWVMWYKKKQVYNTKTVWRGSHSIDGNEFN